MKAKEFASISREALNDRGNYDPELQDEVRNLLAESERYKDLRVNVKILISLLAIIVGVVLAVQ